MSENKVKRIKQTVNIPVRDLHPHPKNPRKNLGDLEELTESIKKNGIMQNLTVIPGFYRANGEWFNTEAEYTVIIGHRRLEAAKLAGLTEVPCRIYENLSENDQITTMLEENMQRNDLTIMEQAQSFQLCLDLGETVDTLSEKTGFKKTTIYHRLNIAKLDQKVLKEKEEDEGFQLTLTDLIELEKIEDIETRNRILDHARTSNDLRFQAQQDVKDSRQRMRSRGWIRKRVCRLCGYSFRTVERYSLTAEEIPAVKISIRRQQEKENIARIKEQAKKLKIKLMDD